MRLVRMTVHSHPRFRAHTALEFSSGTNVLLGQNGTGKTTLLDLIACVCASDFSSYEHVHCDIAYELQTVEAQIDVRLSNERSKLRADTNSKLPADFARPPFEWRCAIRLLFKSGTKCTVEYTPRTGKVQINDSAEREINVASPFERRSVLVGAIFEIAGALPKEEATLAYSCVFEVIDGAQNCFRFDEALGAFDSMIGSNVSTPAGFSIIEQRLPATQDKPRPRYYPTRVRSVPKYVISETLKQATRWKVDAGKDVLPSFYLYDADIEFLHAACEAMGFQASRMEVKVRRKEQEGEDVMWTLDQWRFEFLEHDGRGFTHEGLSFGQKRLLSFMYYIACNDSFVVADELVNGLHHQWIELALQRLESRQSFLSSQNPLLLDHLSFDDVGSVQQCFIVCSKDTPTSKDAAVSMCPRNLGQQEARLFYRHLQAGVQQVSAILSDMGLW